MIFDALNFVKGSIAKKDLVPELQHVQIKDGRITGFNGTLSLSAPIDMPDVIPEANTFIRAVNTAAECSEDIDLKIEEPKFKITAGDFTAYIDCLTEWTDTLPGPSGEKKDLDAALLPVAKMLLPFISQDASRPWSRGIYFKNQCAYVTNNIILIQMFAGAELPFEVILPIGTIKEMIRIKEEPIAMSCDDNTLTLFYKNDRWLKSCIIDGSWPEFESMFDNIASDDGEEVSAYLFQTISKILPFLGEDRSVYFMDGKIRTSSHKKTGVNFDTDLPYTMRFNADQLMLLEKVAEKINFAAYPEPCTFFGPTLRGLIMGQII